MAKMSKRSILISFAFLLFSALTAQERGRVRDFGIEPGILDPGLWNAITDVKGVKVGHKTLVNGDSVRTGVTIILPHDGNLFTEKVPAAVWVGNGFGKAIGFTQVKELGNLETPIALTNTLSVFTVADGLVDHMLSFPENSEVRSVNPVVGETNDGWLNDIRGQHVRRSDVADALGNATSGRVEEGNVGAGTGTLCMGYKGGIGTSSRILSESNGGYTVGVLVQTNFGGILTIDGAPVGKELGNHYLAEKVKHKVDGSCMIIIATDAPLSERNLERLAKRSFLALGRVGSFMSNGSGDYAIAFTTHPGCRIPHHAENPVFHSPQLENNHISPLFLAVVEATEEAIYNSLFMAEDMKSHMERRVKALPINKTLDILDNYSRLDSKTLKLFNGKDLDGWYTFLQHRGRNNDPKEVFTVHDGMIRISGEEWGCITTEEEYENYRLLVEFKWAEKTFEPRLDNARDCGLLLHSQGEDGGSQGIWMHSIECQIIEGGTGDIIVVGDGSDRFSVTCKVDPKKPGNALVYHPEGEEVTIRQGRINWYGRDPEWKDQLGFRGKKDVEKPAGEWNVLECIANGDQLTFFLNGTLVNRATQVKPSGGRIQIQSEAAEIYIRKVELTPYLN